MPSKAQFYAQLADRTAKRITSSVQDWTAFLDTAGRIYKYPHHEQLMIFAQRPDATACADYDFWNYRWGRYVKRGGKGIALLDVNGDRPRIRYVFDISDTGEMKNAREVFLWKYREEHRKTVMKEFGEAYGVSGESSLKDQIEVAASMLADDYWNQNRRDILDILADSALGAYDEFQTGIAFRNAATVSIACEVLSRCGIDYRADYREEDFQSVLNSNTPSAVTVLGTAVSTISRELLRQIEKTVKRYERENAERTENDGRTDVQDNRRSADSRTDPAGAESGASGEIRADAEELSERIQTGSVESNGPLGDTVPAPEGDRQDGEETDERDDAGIDETERRDGEAESGRPDEVDGVNEQPESAGGGDDPERADFQLSLFDFSAIDEQASLFPTEAEQIRRITEAENVPGTLSAFSMHIPQKTVDQILQNGSNTAYSRMNIIAEYAKGKSNEELAAFLKKQYHGGFGLHTDYGDVSAWYDEDGIRMAHGNSTR